eukprot:18042-Heterococcus_DN1.PRE.2
MSASRPAICCSDASVALNTVDLDSIPLPTDSTIEDPTASRQEHMLQKTRISKRFRRNQRLLLPACDHVAIEQRAKQRENKQAQFP